MSELRTFPVIGSASRAALMLLVVGSLTKFIEGGADDKDEKREPIGAVLGKTIYRDQLRDVKESERGNRLVLLFGSPLMVRYQTDHKAELQPTDDEIRQAAEYFDRKHRERIKDEEPKLKEELRTIATELESPKLSAEKRKELENRKERLEFRLKPPGRPFAMFVLSSWKLQRHFYDNYGGGRVLWQQAGQEAFDAMRTWLEACEKKGDFTIDDPELRKSFYSYWTRSHGAFLTDDKDRIRTEFLEPEWAPWTKKPK